MGEIKRISSVGEGLSQVGAGAPAHRVAGRGRRLGIAALCGRSGERELLHEILAVAGLTEGVSPGMTSVSNSRLQLRQQYA